MNTSKMLGPVSLALPVLLSMACGAAHDSQMQATWAQGAVVRTDKGLSVADIQDTVDLYRADLGGVNNLNAAGTQAQGHREINWDGVPADKSAPNLFPGDFFKTRGLLISAPCNQLQVSSKAAESSLVEFGNINAKLPALFTSFSPEKLFSPLGSNIVNLTFTVPGSDEPATVTGFGTVFSDVDLAKLSKIEFFNEQGKNILTVQAEAVPYSNESLSFVGVTFKDGQKIAKVRITNGNVPLSSYAGESKTKDLVVMDDFLYAEPQAIQW